MWSASAFHFFYFQEKCIYHKDTKIYIQRRLDKLKGIIKFLQEKAGFISIEAIIVWGLMIALGAWAMQKFYNISEVTLDHAIEINATAMDVHVSGE